MKRISIIRFFILLQLTCGLFIFVPRVSASSLTLSSSTTSLQVDDEYEVSVSLAIGASDGTTYYLRGAFYKPGTTNYCGFSYNGSSWYNGPYSSEGSKNLLPITITNNSWSGTLKAKIDPDDSGCKDSGTYSFKIMRYTASGSSSSDPQNDLTVSVTVPTPTPSPAPTSKPTSVPTATKVPTPTKAPTQMLAKATSLASNTPTAKLVTTSVLSDKAVSTDSAEASTSAYPTAVLAAATGPTDTLSRTPTSLVLGTSRNILPVILSLIGGISIIGCGILAFLIHRRRGRETG